MKKPNTGYYIRMINSIVTESENIGEEMNASYEVVRQSIDNNTLDSLSQEKLSEIYSIFSQGTVKYDVLMDEINKLKAPVKVLGIHKKFEKAFSHYVAGCKEMLNSILVDDAKVDVEAFNASEAKQDEATDEIAFSIQRITQLIVK
ncbi:hypothetical protein CBF34_07915 [Vagococcus penaei]|uniref:Uncharacterized protein n=1 Tax=Vagococcus penaei TaxID=633807 RepID=A0A1Q2D4D1_9ENTE|nr:hypothetical protein [Vagococcus penaei]AQP53213.1 hypothetical protein BW732_02505 [Vagococcus penaei]RSU01014.1 hypothetical protein CBF34_07915 [Vagococcus penaei]